VATDVEQRNKAASAIQAGLADVDGLTFIRPADGARTGGHFLSLVLREPTSRDALLAALHRQGIFLLRTWDMVPAFFQCFSQSFPTGAADSIHLAGHVAHVPVGRFLTPRKRSRLTRAVREFFRTAHRVLEAAGPKHSGFAG
jgi:dTDP-4-amino-4,6-dideoxygalactose transaminase